MQGAHIFSCMCGMKYFALLIATCLPLSAKEYPSLASQILTEYEPSVATRNAESRVTAAQTFLNSLTPDLRLQAQHDINSDERTKWTNIPPRGPQGGVRIGDLNAEQMKKAMDLLATVLSEQGYAKMRNIPLADDKLLKNGKRRPGYGAEDYWLVVFGKPSRTEPWALQFDGHHVALNVTMKAEDMSISPSFIGTQPRKFLLNGKEVEVIQAKADKAHDLILSLTPEQKKKAIVSQKRGRIQTAAGKDGVIPALDGIAVSEFTKIQRVQLLYLLHEYIADMPKKQANKRLEKLEKEIPQMHFSWSGPTPHKSDMSYKIQGPTLIIEYACQSLGGDPLDHVHSMYRDPTNEYGKTILGEK